MKGQKTGGRQAGTPNKVTTEIRNFLSSLVFDNIDLITQDFRQLTTEQRMILLPKILPYIAPRMKPQTDDEQEKQEQRTLQLQEYRQHAEQIFNWVEQNQQPQDTQDNIQPAAIFTEQQEPQDITAEVNEKDTNSNGNEALTTDNAPTDNITEEDMMHLKQKLHDFVRQEYKRRFPQNSEYSKDSQNSENSEYSHNSEGPQNSEGPRNSEGPQNSENSEYSQNSENSEYSEYSDLSAQSDFPAPTSAPAYRRRLVPAPKSQHTPFYKALNLKKTHNKRNKRR